MEQYKLLILKITSPIVVPGDRETFDSAFLIFCISWSEEIIWRNPSKSLSASAWNLAKLEKKNIFEEVIDRESPTTGVWVLDWVIHN